MKKRFISIILSLVMMLSLLPAGAAALAGGPAGIDVNFYRCACEWRSGTDSAGQTYYELSIDGSGASGAVEVYIDAADTAGYINGRISVTNMNKPMKLVIKNLHLYYSNQTTGGQWDQHAPLEISGSGPVELLLIGDNTFGKAADGSMANGNGCCGIGVYPTSSLIIADAPGEQWYETLNADLDHGKLTCVAGGGGAAGIGGFYFGSDTAFPHGDITINSGEVTIEGSGRSGGSGGAGIGGSASAGYSPNGGNVTINGGYVSVESFMGAAAIGGAAGYVGANGPVYGIGGHVAVNGGVLKAKADVKAEIVTQSNAYEYRTGMVIGAGANEANVLTTKTDGKYDQSFSVQNAIVSLSANAEVRTYSYFPVNVESYAEEAPYIASHIKNCVFAYERHDTNGQRVMENAKVYGDFKLTQDYTIKIGDIIMIPSDATFTVASGVKLTVEPTTDPPKVLDIPEQGILAGRANSLILEKGTGSNKDGEVVGYGTWPEIFTLNIPELPPDAPVTPEEVTDDTRVKYLAVVQEYNGTAKRIVAGNSAAELAPNIGSATVLTVLTAGYRGFAETQDGYEIDAGSVGVNISLTANGSLKGNGTTGNAKFTISESGGTVTAEGKDIALSSPSYTIFSPKNGKGFEIEFDAGTNMAYGKTAFTATFDSADNNALISIPELYGSSFVLESIAPVKDKSALRFGGKLSLSTPVVDIANLTINKLQLDFAGSSVTLGGIEADARLEIPKIAGFVGGKAEAQINTFVGEGTNEGQFMFSVEVETPVVSGEFYLDFAEAYGVILPNSLYAAAKVGSGGIPLVPPTTVAYINGGGLGVYDLAKTIGMNRLALPPIRLRMTGSGSIVDVIDGTVDLVAGPGYSKVELSDIKIADTADILSKVGMIYNVNLEQLEYNNNTYDVAAMHTQMYIEAGLSLLDKECLTANGSVGFDAYAGLNVDIDTANPAVRGIFRVESSGELGGSLKIPEGIIFGLPLSDINIGNVKAGYHLAGTINPVVELADPLKAFSTESFLDAFKPEGAIAAKASVNLFLVKIWARVGYILGASPTFDGGFGDGPELFASSITPISGAGGGDSCSVVEKVDGSENDYSFMQVNAKVLADTAKNDGGVSLMSVTGTQPGVTLDMVGSNHKSYTATIDSSVSDPKQVVYIMTAKSGRLAEGDFTITNTSGSVTLVKPAFDATTGEQLSSPANPNFGIDDKSADNEPDVAYFTPGDRDTYTITCSVPIDIQAVLFSPYATLDKTGMSLTGSTVAYGIADRADGTDYAVKVYISETQGGMDYLVGEGDVPANADSSSVTISNTGARASTGDYYVTVALMEKVTIGAGSNAISGWVVADKWNTDANSYHYTYNSGIDAPTNPALSYSGNETMTASWDKVPGAEGYVVTVYDSAGNDTGVTYQTTAELDSTGTITVDAATSVTMALTADTKDAKGKVLPGLASGVSYKIGVKAFKTVSATSNAALTTKAYSDEAMSGDVTLPVAAPPTLTFSNGVIPQGSFQYTMLLNKAPVSRDFTVTASENCTFTVTNVTDPKNPVTVSPTSTTSNSATVTVPTFVGSIQLEIEAKSTTTGDYTINYVTVQLDDTAPTLTLNDGGNFFKSTGTANVTGRTEANAAVLAWAATGSPTAPSASTRAASDGTFTLPLTAGTFSVEAMDSAKNRSTPVKATVAAGSTVSPEDTSFTQYGAGVVAFTLTPGANAALSALKCNGVVMTEGRDYAVSGNVYTLTASFVAALPVGGALFTFDMDAGNDPTALLTIVKGNPPASYSDPKPDGWVNPFTDVAEDDWFFEDVKYVASKGMMNGTGEDVFDPHGTTTRGMLVTILYRLAGEPDIKGSAPFRDVATGAYYARAVAWAAENGIVDGFEDGTFGAQNAVTREQMAAILYRYVKLIDGGSAGDWSFPLDFTDASKVGSWAYEAMCWCAKNGILTGYEDGSLGPQNTARRSQSAAILHRYCELRK